LIRFRARNTTAHHQSILARRIRGGSRIIARTTRHRDESLGLVQSDRGGVRAANFQEDLLGAERPGVVDETVKERASVSASATVRFRICASPGASIRTPYATMRPSRSPTLAQ
jgi:hypothetical protein